MLRSHLAEPWKREELRLRAESKDFVPVRAERALPIYCEIPGIILGMQLVDVERRQPRG